MFYENVNPMDSADDDAAKTASEPGPCNVSAENRTLISDILKNVDTIAGILFGPNGDECGDQTEPPIDCLLSDLEYQHDQLERLSKKLYIICKKI